MKGFNMTVFGQEYDLSNCTPEEQTEVQKWYDSVKNESVPEPVEHEYPSAPEVMRMDKHEGRVKVPSDPEAIAEAVLTLQPNPEFNPELEGKPERVAFYKKVHPLGGNMSIEDAAAEAGIDRVTGWRWVKKIEKDNPTADYSKWPTTSQLNCYRLIHPDLGGLTLREAAKALGVSYQHVCDLMRRMNKTHPQAFGFRHMKRPKVVTYTPSIHEEQVKEVF